MTSQHFIMPIENLTQFYYLNIRWFQFLFSIVLLRSCCHLIVQPCTTNNTCLHITWILEFHKFYERNQQCWYEISLLETESLSVKAFLLPFFKLVTFIHLDEQTVFRHLSFIIFVNITASLRDKVLIRFTEASTPTDGLLANGIVSKFCSVTHEIALFLLKMTMASQCLENVE